MLAIIQLYLLLFPLTPSRPAQSQPSKSPELSSRLKVRVENYSLSGKNLPDALRKVGSVFKIPMGIEWVAKISTGDPINLSFANTTVWEIIQSAVSREPDYSVEEKNGILHVYSPHLLTERENFLSLTISEFDAEN
jgi:hypothetical protein